MINFELVYVRHNLSGKAPRISPSSITFFDLTVLLSGKLEYTIDGKETLLESGDVIFIPTGSVRARRESDVNVDYISFNFTSSCDFKLPLVMKNAVRSEVAMLVTAYDKMCKHAYYDNKEKAEYLCGCIISVLKDIAAASQYSPLTKKIMSHIHSDISQKITLEEIGRLTFFSPIYCDTVFKKETGRSIIDYVLDRRIDEAKKLLLEGTMSLSQIGETLGFGDYNYFSRVFKKRSGYSPTAYRRLVLSEFEK